MGVWNATCAISHLPIQGGEPCRILLLAEAIRTHRGSGGFHDTEEIWKPMTVPIKGVYDAYGSATALEPEWYLDVVARNLGVLSVDRRDISLSEVLERIHGEPILLDVGAEGPLHLGMVFIREDIYQALASSPYIEGGQFVDLDVLIREEKDTLARELNFSRLSRTTAGLAESSMVPFEDKETGETVDVVASARQVLEGLGNLLRGFVGTRDGCPAFEPLRSAMAEKMVEGLSLEDDSIRWGVLEIAKFRLVRLHMDALRRSWMPQPGLGSQSTGWHSNMVLHQCVQAIVEKSLESESR